VVSSKIRAHDPPPSDLDLQQRWYHDALRDALRVAAKVKRKAINDQPGSSYPSHSTQGPSNLQVPGPDLDLLGNGGMSRVPLSPGNLDFSCIQPFYGPGRVGSNNEQFQMDRMDQMDQMGQMDHMGQMGQLSQMDRMDQPFIYGSDIHEFEPLGQSMFGNNPLPGVWTDECHGDSQFP
jgi:hypothetical protein